MSKWLFLSAAFLTVIMYYLSPSYSLVFLFMVFVLGDLFYKYGQNKVKNYKDLVPYVLSFLLLIILFYYSFKEISLFSYLFVLLSLYVFLNATYGGKEWEIALLVGIILLSLSYVAPYQFEVVKSLENLDDATFTEKIKLGTLYVMDYISNVTYSFLNKQMGLQLDDNLRVDVKNEKEQSFNPYKYVIFEKNKGLTFEVKSYESELIPETNAVFSLILHNNDAGKIKDVDYGVHKGELAYALDLKCNDEDSKEQQNCLYHQDEMLDDQYLYAYPSYSLPPCVTDKLNFYSFIKYLHLTTTTKSFVLAEGFSKSKLSEVTPGKVATAIWLEPLDYNYIGGDAKFNVVFRPFIITSQKGEYQAYIPFLEVTVPYFLKLSGSACNILQEKISNDGLKRIYYLYINKDGCLMKDYSNSLICSAVIEREDAEKVKADILNIKVYTPYVYYYSKPLELSIKGRGYEKCSFRQTQELLSYFKDGEITMDKYYVAKIKGTLNSPLSSLVKSLSDNCLKMFKDLPGEHRCYDVIFKSESLPYLKEEEKTTNEKEINLKELISVEKNPYENVVYNVINDASEKKREYELEVHHIKKCNIDYIITRLS